MGGRHKGAGSNAAKTGAQATSHDRSPLQATPIGHIYTRIAEHYSQHAVRPPVGERWGHSYLTRPLGSNGPYPTGYSFTRIYGPYPYRYTQAKHGAHHEGVESPF